MARFRFFSRINLGAPLSGKKCKRVLLFVVIRIVKLFVLHLNQKLTIE